MSSNAAGEASEDELAYRRRLNSLLATLPASVTASGAELWKALGANDLLAPLYDPYHKRSPVKPPVLRILVRALDEYCTVGATLSVCVQAASAAPLLLGDSHSNDADVLRGRTITALAVTDARTSGSTLGSDHSSIHIGSDHVVVTGTKHWITNATMADQIVVLARHRSGNGLGDLTFVRVPAAASGVTVTPARTPFWVGSGIGHCHFDNVAVEHSRIVGGIGRGVPLFTTHITTERWCSSWWAASIARRILADTRRRLIAKPGTNGPLWTQQAIQHRFAACVVQYRMVDGLCRQWNRTGTDAPDVSGAMLAKAASGLMLNRVLEECGQLQGADGFADGGIQSLRAETAMFPLAGGAVESLLLALAGDAERLLQPI